jgi:hypothetical protein
MKTKDLYKLEDIIKDILEKDYMARSDDAYLIFRVVQVTHPHMAGTTFAEVMLNAKRNKLNFESIRRCRQKIQAKYPELKDKYTAEVRENEQDEYERYALN